LRVDGGAINPASLAFSGPLTEEELRSGLRTTLIGRRILALQETGSTNQVAMELAAEGAPEGTVVVAEAQTRGKGRFGRTWASPAGLGIYTSIVLRPPIPSDRVPIITLIAGVAVAEAIREATGLAVSLKWPNDVLIRGRKAAGILAELDAEAEVVRYVVVGIGINVNQALEDFPLELRESASSLKIGLGHEIHRTVLAQCLFEKMETWYLRFLREGSTPILQRFEDLCINLSQEVRVRSEEGLLEGLATGIDPEGALLLRLQDGSLVRVLAGEVTLRKD